MSNTVGEPPPVKRPDLAGERIQDPGQAAIYLIDDNGTRRWIPDPDTYNNLFRDWYGIDKTEPTREIVLGTQISRGAYLARVSGTAPVYLIDNGQKRWVSSSAVMDKFYFNWDKVKPIDAVTLSNIPPGPDIT